VDVDLNDLKNKNKTSCKKLQQLNELLLLNTEKEQTFALDKKVISDKLKENEKQLAEIWKEQKVCPLCKQEINK